MTLTSFIVLYYYLIITNSQLNYYITTSLAYYSIITITTSRIVLVIMNIVSCWLALPGPATAPLALELLIWKRLKRQVKLMMGLSASISLANVEQPRENFGFYNMYQITLGKHEHGKYCGSASRPARLQRGQLNSKGSSSYGKYKKDRLNR